ncbi:MAG: hypothetical protein PVJ38_05095 [Candidatus Bathyarchaeota archaeon]|jgi:hypothetical protein
MTKKTKTPDVDLQTDWQDTQLELLKTLEGYKIVNKNEELGSLDYVAENEDGEKKLLRVMIDPKFNASAAYLVTIKKTLESVEEGPYEEATILAKRLTKASRRLVRSEGDLEYISNKKEPYSHFEVIEALQNLTTELCTLKCGSVPQTEGDCEGYNDGEYSCNIRRISDDADFHAKMGWLKLLMNDFSRLITLQREINNSPLAPPQ